MWEDMRLRADMSVDMPNYILIEVGNYCNLRCPGCYTGQKTLGFSQGFMSVETAEKVAENIKSDIKTVVLHNWGEIFLNPHYNEIISAFSSRGMYTTVDANLVSQAFTDEEAELIVGSGLSRIMASLDGATQETYELYRRRGNLERGLENLRVLLKAQRRLGVENPQLIWKYLVHDRNEHEMMLAQERADEIGVPIIFALNNVSRWSNIRSKIEKGVSIDPSQYNGDFSRRQSDFESIEIDHLKIHDALHQSFCKQPFWMVVAHWDGRVLPCCGAYSDKETLGDLTTQTLAEVWNGEPMKAVRRFVMGYGPKQTGRTACETGQCAVGRKHLPPLTTLMEQQRRAAQPARMAG